MKLIAIVAVIGVVLLQFSGGVPDSSVGGPMTLLLAFMLAALAVGVHDAYTQGRGIFGWIVSVLAALVGGVSAGMLGGSLMDLVMPLLQLEGSLASTRHPLLYVFVAAMMLLTLLGAWLALWLVNRMR